jgi:hypothetical protein
MIINLIVGISIILLSFTLVAFIVGGFPLVLAVCVTQKSTIQLMPAKENSTATSSFLLQAFNIFIVAVAFTLSFLGYRLKSTSNVDLGIMLEKLCIVAIILVDTILFLTIYFGSRVIDNV